MKEDYIYTLIDDFSADIENISNVAEKKIKIHSVYTTLFEIAKNDFSSFINGIQVFSKKYMMDEDFKSNKLPQLFLQNLLLFKKNNKYFENHKEICIAYKNILQSFFVSNYQTQHILLRNIFDNNDLPPIIIQEIISHFDKNLLWGKYCLSQALYINTIDELLDFWNIPTSYCQEKISHFDEPTSMNNNHYWLSCQMLDVLFKKSDMPLSDNGNYQKKAMISLFKRLQQKTPNKYPNYAQSANINLLDYMYDEKKFLEHYFLYFFEYFKSDFLQIKEIEKLNYLNDFFSYIIYKFSFPHNVSLCDQNETMLMTFEKYSLFTHLTKAYELKNYLVDKNHYFELTCKNLQEQEVLAKSYNKEIYLFFFDRRLQYKASNSSFCFPKENAKIKQDIQKI